MIRSKAIYALLLSLLVSFCACSKDDEPDTSIPSDAVYDMVTLVASSKSGSTFEMRKVDDSPVITYTSKYDLASSSTHIDVGDRVIICYKRNDGAVYTSGPITLYGYVTLSNTSRTVTEGDISFPLKPISLVSMWRTGQYINIEAAVYVYVAQKPEKYELIIDRSTIDEPFPQLYVVYSNKSDNDGVNPFTVSASFDMQSIWDRPSCQGITVNYATQSGMKSQTFNKN